MKRVVGASQTFTDQVSNRLNTKSIRFMNLIIMHNDLFDVVAFCKFWMKLDFILTSHLRLHNVLPVSTIRHCIIIK